MMTDKTDDKKSEETEEKKDLVIKHGLLLHDTYKFPSKVLSLIYDSAKDSFIVLHRGAISIYQYGLKKRVISEGVSYTNLLYATEYDRYVGVSEYALYLLEADLSIVLYESTTDYPVSCCLYNCYNKTIITAGTGYINVWRFHRGGKSLLSDHVMKEGLHGEAVSLLHAEEVPGNAQRLFAVVGNGIKVFLLASFRLINEGKSLHCRPISAVLFFRPLTYLITGARDGSIKVWNQTWTLQYAFISHQSPVTAIMPHPVGPCIISGSLDGTLRLWNLIHWDTVQVVDHVLPVKGLYSEPGHHLVLSYSCKQVKTWSISELYSRMTIVGSDAVRLSPSSHPMSLLRLTGIFTDSTVRILSPVGGAILSTVLLPLGTVIVNAVHMPHHEWVFLLTSDGDLFKYDTSTKPSQKISQWTPPQTQGKFTCLTMYQLIMEQDEIDELIASDKWLSVIIEGHKMKRHGMGNHPLKKTREGVHLIIAGTETGYICVLDHETGGEPQCFVKSYSTPVLNLIPHPKRDQLLSITSDACIRIWRVYAYTKDCIEPIMSFCVSGIPSHVCVLLDRICVAINNEDRASYTNTMYSLSDDVVFSSNPLNDHTETITALDVCTPMHLFVTSSRDCSIRIWSQNNHILRILLLDAMPTAIAFSSPFGGLTVSLRHHLYTISHSTHLTVDYVKQLVSLGVREDSLKGEEPRQLIKCLDEFDKEDQIRLEPVDDHLEVTSYRGALSEEELNILDRIKEAKRQGMEQLVEQDKELKHIRDGILIARKKETSALSKALKNKAWRELYSMIRVAQPHNVPVIPKLDDFDPDTYGIIIETPEPYEPFKEEGKRIFFPPLSKFLPPYPIAPDGFLPNSVVLQKLRKSDEDKMLAKQWRPPVLSERQKKMMVEKVEVEEEPDDNTNTEVMDRIREAMLASPPQRTPSPSPPPTPPPRPPKEVKAFMKAERPPPSKPKPKPPPPPPPKPVTPVPSPPPRSPTPPPPPPTPLPDYIAQFIGQPWFESLYQNATSKTFPKPWTVTRFIYALLSWFNKPIDPSIKGDICAALLKLIKEFKPKNSDEVRSAVISLLMGPPAVSSKDILERYLAKRGLELLIHINELDYPFMSLLMAYFSEGNPEISRMVIDYFGSRSIIDPYNYFTNELENNLAKSGTQISELITRSTAWLDSWNKEYLKSRGIKIPLKKDKKSRGYNNKAGSKSQPELQQLPYCDPIDVIKHFIRTEREKELARLRPATPPPPPPEPEVDAPHDVVVPLPVLDHTHSGLVRLGETHCSKCHPERETSLARVNHLVRVQRKVTNDSLRTINLSLKTQNVNPFLSPEERRELELLKQSQNTLISHTRLFLLEHSYPQ